jgi:hypothetical protein
MLALTSPTRGGRSVGIVRSRTQATQFLLSYQDTQWLPSFILSTSSHHIHDGAFSILSSHLHLGLPSGVLLSEFCGSPNTEFPLGVGLQVAVFSERHSCGWWRIAACIVISSTTVYLYLQQMNMKLLPYSCRDKSDIIKYAYPLAYTFPLVTPFEGNVC